MKDLSAYGTHFLVGLSGVVLSDCDRRILSSLRPAGVVLFKYNFLQEHPYEEWFEQLSTLLQQVEECIGREKFFVAIDHEGGRVHRVPAPLSHFPSAACYAKQSANAARVMAKELKSIGCNLSLAPVADVHSNKDNPIIGERAFGRTPDEVMAAAIPFAQALLANGVLCCAKHFPGHGDTSTDSHIELPIVRKDKGALLDCELKPFQALVKIKIPLIMTAHILFPKLDPLHPATLSTLILKDLLRREMGFKGVIISDDLHMKAVAEIFKKEEAVGESLKAGCDMFCVSRFGEPESELPLILAENLAETERQDRTFRKIRERSSKRIERLIRSELKMYDPALLSKEELKRHQEICTPRSQA